MKIKLKRWGTEQKLLSSLSHWAPLESFIKFYHIFKLLAEFLRI